MQLICTSEDVRHVADMSPTLLSPNMPNMETWRLWRPVATSFPPRLSYPFFRLPLLLGVSSSSFVEGDLIPMSCFGNFCRFPLALLTNSSGCTLPQTVRNKQPDHSCRRRCCCTSWGCTSVRLNMLDERVMPSLQCWVDHPACSLNQIPPKLRRDRKADPHPNSRENRLKSFADPLIPNANCPVIPVPVILGRLAWVAVAHHRWKSHICHGGKSQLAKLPCETSSTIPGPCVCPFWQERDATNAGEASTTCHPQWWFPGSPRNILHCCCWQGPERKQTNSQNLKNLGPASFLLLLHSFKPASQTATISWVRRSTARYLAWARGALLANDLQYASKQGRRQCVFLWYHHGQYDLKAKI